MRKLTCVILLQSGLILGAASSCFARVEDYGPTRYTRVGHDDHHHDHGHDVVIDRRHGSGWGDLAAGVLGAVAGAAIGHAIAPPVVSGPPPLGAVVPYLPPGCVNVPGPAGEMLYNCGNIYYRPIYEGTSLMYQIVPTP